MKDNQKAIFLDLDGTVVDHGDVLYDSAITAIKTAIKNGHKVFICTGRERSFIAQKIFDIGATDGVFGAGSSVVCDGKLIFKSSFTAEQYEKIIAVLFKHNACFALENDEGELIPEGMFERDIQAQNALLAIGAKMIPSVPKTANDIDKIIYILADSDRPVLQAQLEGVCEIIASSYLEDDRGGEVMQVGITKEHGIRQIMQYYGIEQKDTICVGDSNNDFEMVQFCHLGIAMGNSCDRLKAVADFISSDIKDDGLFRALEFAGVV